MMRIAAIIVFTLTALVTGASAQEPYPSRPISIVNPFPPGGIADLTARPLAASFERLLKQPVVVVNKAGAAGAVGTQFAPWPSPTDTPCSWRWSASPPCPRWTSCSAGPPRTRATSSSGIARLNADPPVLAVNATVEDAQGAGGRRARSAPARSPSRRPGLYGASHVPLEMFLQAAGASRCATCPPPAARRRPPRCSAATPQLWASPPRSPRRTSRRARCGALATWGATRLAAFPDVPTLKELGYDVEYYLWAGLFAPRGVPANVIQTLRDATRKAVEDPEFKSSHGQGSRRRSPIRTPTSSRPSGIVTPSASAATIQFIGKTEAK